MTGDVPIRLSQGGTASSPTAAQASWFFGRDEALAAVLHSTAPLCVVSGDAGMGKTTLLERASRDPALGVASTPYRVLQSEPFEHALVVALADVLRRLAAERGRARELATSLTAVLSAMRETAVSDVPEIVMSALLTSLLPGIGDSLAKSFKALRKHLRAGGAAGLGARAGESVSPLVVQTLGAILSEAATLADGARLTLVLDNGERGGTTDHRVLADIAEALPDRVRIVVGFRTGDLASADALEDLLQRSERAAVVALEPLDVADVRAWLETEGLPAAEAERVHALTEGHPLVVGDTVLLRAAGDQLPDVAPANVFVRLTESSWRNLSALAQRAARRLSVFDQPLPRETVLELLGLDTVGWAQLLDELRRARIAVERDDGAADIHNLRRRVILDRLLESFERPQLFADGARAVRELIERTEDVAWLGEYASLVERADPLRVEDPVLDLLCETSDDELRVLASVAELQSTYDVELEGIAYYAAAIWHLETGASQVLMGLVERGLVSTFGGEDEIVYVDADTGESRRELSEPHFVPRDLDSAQHLLFLGRCVRRLGRVPVDGVALAAAAWFGDVETTAFNLRPGYALNHELLQSWASFGPAPALIAKGRYTSIPLCAVVWYADEALRDRAAEGVVPRELLHGRLEVDDVVALPAPRAPALRWLRAVCTPQGTRALLSRLGVDAPSPWLLTEHNAVAMTETASGDGNGNGNGNEAMYVDPMLWLSGTAFVQGGDYFTALAGLPDRKRTPGEALTMRQALDRAVWRRCDGFERFALELRPRMSWHWSLDDGRYVEIGVATAAGPEEVVEHDALPSGGDARARSEIRSRLGLGGTVALSHRT